MTDIQKKSKGILEIEVNGEMRRFKFGTLHIAILLEMEKCNMGELLQRLSEPSNLMLIVRYFHVAACQYSRLKKETDPSIEEVADWYDNMTPEQREALNKAALETFIDPNESAPKTEKTEGQS
jgi:hypothetical protein